MFADLALAVRIDGAEARLSASVATALKPGRGDQVMLLPLGAHGRAVFVWPGSPFNKVIGAGLGEGVDESILAQAEVHWCSHGDSPRVELAALASPDVGSMLGRRGYALHGFENVLARTLEPGSGKPARGTPELSITRVEEQTSALWASVGAAGFSHPDETSGLAEQLPRGFLDQSFADVALTPGFHRYLAYVQGEPAGAATLRLDGGIAQLCGATTLPRFRRRGVQAALLAARLSDASTAGCDLAVVTTAPGTVSMANALRHGFVMLYARAILIATPNDGR